MKKSFLLVLIIVFVSFGIKAQEETETAGKTELKEGWNYSGVLSLTASQVNFSNWSAGGENSHSINGLIALKADYKKDKHFWGNDLAFSYGVMKQGEKELRKTDDKFEFNSAYGYQASEVWYYTAVLNFQTQFSEGYKYDDKNDTKAKISNLFAPAYLNFSLGMAYKPSPVFSMFIGPVSAKMTFVNDDELSDIGAFGVDPGEKSKSEIGGILKAEFNKDILKNVNLLSKLTLFSAYTNNPQNIDVDWQLLFNMKINEWLSANLNLHLIYDDDIKTITPEGVEGPKVQFKEVFGLGLNLKF